MKGIFKIAGSLLCLSMICFTSCRSKTTPIEDLANLTEDVKVNGKSYSEKDWQVFTEDLELIDQELQQYREEYTDEEKKEIGRLKGTCLGYLTMHSAKKVKTKMEDALKEADGIVEGFSDAFVNGLDE